VAALIAAASKTRNGLNCKIPALTRNTDGELNMEYIRNHMGGQNCHVDVVFEDGTVWLARIRLDDPLLPPKPTQTYIFHSEVATLRFLEETAIPSPKVYAYEAESSINPVGASYMFMEKMPGVPLQWDQTTPAQKTIIMYQIIDNFLELEKHPRTQSGSPYLDHDMLKVGGFAQPPLFSSPDQTIGPFESLEDFLNSAVSQQLDQIVNHELSSLAVDNYLSHCWRRDMITQATAHCYESGREFFLKHYDDKGDHILVDDDFRITGVIDWEFASFEPKALAFSTPCMLWPVGDYYNGRNELCDEEIQFAQMLEVRGRNDMSKIVRESRKMQRFTFFNGGGVSRDQEEFEALFTGLSTAWAKDDDPPISYDEWKKEAIQKQGKHERLQTLLKRSSGRFHN